MSRPFHVAASLSHTVATQVVRQTTITWPREVSTRPDASALFKSRSGPRSHHAHLSAAQLCNSATRRRNARFLSSASATSYRRLRREAWCGSRNFVPTSFPHVVHTVDDKSDRVSHLAPFSGSLCNFNERCDFHTRQDTSSARTPPSLSHAPTLLAPLQARAAQVPWTSAAKQAPDHLLAASDCASAHKPGFAHREHLPNWGSLIASTWAPAGRLLQTSSCRFLPATPSGTNAPTV